MSDTITLGRRLIPIAHVVLAEPFDPAANPRFESDKPFRTRVVLLDRDSVLTETPPQAFGEANGFRLLPDDAVFVNPAIRFRVESFEPGQDFQPTKPFATRLMWKDLDGQVQSKLLLSKPELVLAVAVQGAAEKGEGRELEAPAPRERAPRSASRRRARRSASATPV